MRFIAVAGLLLLAACQPLPRPFAHDVPPPNSAVLTPPDVISQVSLALPIIVLYEISIICGRMVEKSRAAREAAEEAANP